MKVLEVGKSLSDMQRALPELGKTNTTQSTHSFQRQMVGMNENAHRHYIEKLQEKIAQQGDILRQKADVTELQKYRSLISELISETVSNAYACSSKNEFGRGNRHRIFVTVRCINKKLDTIAQEILSGQEDNLRLMGMVDDIRGLLLDLFL